MGWIGSPSTSTTSPPSVVTNSPHPPAQYGQMLGIRPPSPNVYFSHFSLEAPVTEAFTFPILMRSPSIKDEIDAAPAIFKNFRLSIATRPSVLKIYGCFEMVISIACEEVQQSRNARCGIP